MSSLWYKGLRIVTKFLVLSSICLSSSLVHFKNDLEYLTTGISFEKFSSWSEEFFSYFSFISACLMVSASSFLKYCTFSFSLSVFILSWFVRLISLHYFCFPIFHYEHGAFFTTKSLYLGCIFVLSVSGSSISFFFFFFFLQLAWCRSYR